MTPSIKWTRIPLAHSLPRSSHSVTVIGTKAYIFGGEIKAREPVDSAVHVIDIDSGEYTQVSGKGDVPSPRVGHIAARVKDGLAIFGGRGGSAMEPIDESGSVHLFNPSLSTWTRLAPSSASAPYPSARSYHCGTSSPTTNHLFVHAGCGVSPSGTTRTSDLWLFDLDARAWTQLPDAPGEGRGGSAILYSPASEGKGEVAGGKVWRFGGYNGKTELGGSIEVLSLDPASPASPTPGAGAWKSLPFPSPSSADSIQPTGPPARSVAAIAPVQAGQILTFGGEGKPSPTGGHDAAGNFWSDAWVFDPAGASGTGEGSWTECAQEGKVPSARGWFAADADERGRFVIWGGLDGANERLGDGYVGVVEL